MSLLSFSASRSRIAAWLGLMAMALLFIAPVISKSLAQWHSSAEQQIAHPLTPQPSDNTSPATGVAQHAHHPMQSMPAMLMPPSSDSALPAITTSRHGQHPMQAMGDLSMLMMQHGGMPMMDDSACGYCVLLLHLPLALLVLALLWSALTSIVAPIYPRIITPVTRLIAASFQPRAPPSLLAVR